jgi:AcrR family transcriptional regulator
MDASPPAAQADSQRLNARARILETAYELFSTYGVRAIGVDRVVAEAGIAKMTLYRHFPSKDDLILAFLELRQQRWTRDWLLASVERVAPSPEDRLLAFFDVLDEWFHEPGYEGCAFLRTLHEVTAGPIHEATIRHLDLIREQLVRYAAQAGASDPGALALQTQVLMMGAIVSALRGDLDAARRARVIAEAVLAGAT